MPRPSLLWLGLLACCHPARPAAHPPVDTPCSPTRIGSVAIVGATPALVPTLAVLAGTFDDRERTQRFAEGAVDTLAMRGYPNARVTVERAPGCFVDLTVRVELGARYKIGRIEFQTDDAFPARERYATIEDALGTVNTVGGVYIGYRLERGLTALERRYRDAGWLDVAIDKPDTAYRGGEVEIIVPIRAGARFRVAKVRARSSDPAARKQILAELRDHAGTWYDGPAIRSAIARAKRKLDRESQLGVTIDLRTTTTQDGEVVIEAAVLSAPRTDARVERPRKDHTGFAGRFATASSTPASAAPRRRASEVVSYEPDVEELAP